MAKDFSVETKIKLCGMYRGSIAHDSLDYSKFLKEIIEPNPHVKIYAPLLFIYGTYNNGDRAIFKSKQMQHLLKKQDESFDKWVCLCEQIKFVLETESLDFFYAKHDIGSKKPLGLYNIELFRRKFLKSLIDDLCLFENSISKINLTHPHDITLDSITERLITAEEEKQRTLGANKGRPTSFPLYQSHQAIQELSFLLRIDKLINMTDDSSTIDDVQLQERDFEFIYNFLEYFNILEFEPTENTSTKSDIIKQRFKNPPLNNHPTLKEYIEVVKSKINEECSKLAHLNKVL